MKGLPIDDKTDTKEEIDLKKSYKKLFLEYDIIEAEEPKELDKPKTCQDGVDDYNYLFENKISADEREFLNYDLMFQDIPKPNLFF